MLAGDCVANGYLGGSGTDRARFVDESFLADGRSGPAYRTGDRSVLRDGLIECLGRLDEQVKVRGHRIEIQEVHDLTIAVAGVAQAAVAVRKVGLGGLEIFVVADPDADPGGGAARAVGTARAATWSAASSSTSAPTCRPPRCPSASGSSPASSSTPTASGTPTPPGPR